MYFQFSRQIPNQLLVTVEFLLYLGINALVASCCHSKSGSIYVTKTFLKIERTKYSSVPWKSFVALVSERQYGSPGCTSYPDQPKCTTVLKNINNESITVQTAMTGYSTYLEGYWTPISNSPIIKSSG